MKREKERDGNFHDTWNTCQNPNLVKMIVISSGGKEDTQGFAFQAVFYSKKWEWRGAEGVEEAAHKDVEGLREENWLAQW